MQSGDGDYLLSSPLMHRDDERLVDRSRHIEGARSLTHMGVNDQVSDEVGSSTRKPSSS